MFVQNLWLSTKSQVRSCKYFTHSRNVRRQHILQTFIKECHILLQNWHKCPNLGTFKIQMTQQVPKFKHRIFSAHFRPLLSLTISDNLIKLCLHKLFLKNPKNCTKSTKACKSRHTKRDFGNHNSIFHWKWAQWFRRNSLVRGSS